MKYTRIAEVKSATPFRLSTTINSMDFTLPSYFDVFLTPTVRMHVEMGKKVNRKSSGNERPPRVKPAP